MGLHSGFSAFFCGSCRATCVEAADIAYYYALRFDVSCQQDALLSYPRH